MLCLELSRLSRDDTLQDYVRFLALCSEHQVRLATLSRILDPRESSDWMLLLLEGGFSSVEMRQISLRLRQGKERAWEKGGHVGGAVIQPYRKALPTGTLVVDPEAAEKVRAVLSTFATRGPVAAATLARGFGYHHNTLRRWVSDAGLDWYLARRPSRERPGEWIRCQWPPLLTEEQAAEIRAVRDRTRHGHHRARQLSLLAGMGLLRCGYCGGAVTGQSGGEAYGKRYYYRCVNGGWSDTCPESKLVRQHLLDHAVVSHVLHTLSRADVLAESWAVENQSAADTVAPLRAAEAELLTRKARLVAAVESGVLELADAGRRIKELTADLERIRQDLAAATLPADEPPDFSGLADLSAAWNSLEREERRELLRTALVRVDVFARGAKLLYSFPRGRGGSKEARIHVGPRSCTRPNREKTQWRVLAGGR